jgi:transcriptional regulator of nitric oxide reductase
MHFYGTTGGTPDLSIVSTLPVSMLANTNNTLGAVYIREDATSMSGFSLQLSQTTVGFRKYAGGAYTGAVVVRVHCILDYYI